MYKDIDYNVHYTRFQAALLKPLSTDRCPETNLLISAFIIAEMSKLCFLPFISLHLIKNFFPLLGKVYLNF